MSDEKIGAWMKLWELKNKKDRVTHCAKLLRDHYGDDKYLQVIAHALEGKNFHIEGPSAEEREIGASIMLMMKAGKPYEKAIQDVAGMRDIGTTKVKECYKAVKNYDSINLKSAVYKLAGEDE